MGRRVRGQVPGRRRRCVVLSCRAVPSSPPPASQGKQHPPLLRPASPSWRPGLAAALRPTTMGPLCTSLAPRGCTRRRPTHTLGHTHTPPGWQRQCRPHLHPEMTPEAAPAGQGQGQGAEAALPAAACRAARPSRPRDHGCRPSARARHRAGRRVLPSAGVAGPHAPGSGGGGLRGGPNRAWCVLLAARHDKTRRGTRLERLEREQHDNTPGRHWEPEPAT